MDLPKRKPTRLKDFDYSTAGAYFLTICTSDKKRILSNITVGDGAHDVPKIELTRIGKIVEKYIVSTNKMKNVSVDSYVIMPNHIHLIVFIQESDASNTLEPRIHSRNSPTNALIPHIVSTFKRFCNAEIGENVFQRSYIDHIIRDKEDYEVRRKYIYENPLRWYYKEVHGDE